ncbi:MAG: tRNA (adenosine(37)-N6)-threonylcarbamoyltransferase complex transferase subunit TsaD [Candidatus Sungbacteria bacterium]|nr:tRNA (adenosine(37)-N6)-threonylcarbamoyltransferase complex transferase subunit TsaD [Candidatus Sungbacteria bacterium]
MKILAIETSCDETAVAILEVSGPKRDPKFRVLSHIVSSQIKIHARFGGVVPNLARREHEKNLVPILMQALRDAKLESRARVSSRHSREGGNPESRDFNTRFPIKSGMAKKMQERLHSILEREPELWKHFERKLLGFGKPDIDAIAVTYGPGLAPALWVGVNFAKALNCLWDKPLIPVNHMAGHFYSALIETKKGVQAAKATYKKISFPALALLVSGAHTELVLVKKHGDFRIIGSTLDDAAGEAFDKVARMLGFGYPGGPEIARTAAFGHPESRHAGMKDREIPLRQLTDRNDKFPIKFPRPIINSRNYDFSFSGLKTAVLYFIRDTEKTHSIKKLRPAIAKEFQNAVTDVLVTKTVRAAKEFQVKTVTLGGGVAANAALRERLAAELATQLPKVPLVTPDLSMTGDNALMIALAAYFCGKKTSPDQVWADANVTL